MSHLQSTRHPSITQCTYHKYIVSSYFIPDPGENIHTGFSVFFLFVSPFYPFLLFLFLYFRRTDGRTDRQTEYLRNCIYIFIDILWNPVFFFEKQGSSASDNEAEASMLLLVSDAMDFSFVFCEVACFSFSQFVIFVRLFPSFSCRMFFFTLFSFISCIMFSICAL